MPTSAGSLVSGYLAFFGRRSAPCDKPIHAMSRKLSVDDTYLIVGLEIRKLRIARGLSQEQLARRIRIGQNIVSDMEIGKRRADAHLQQLAEVFGVPVSHFTSLVEPCPHCGGTGLHNTKETRTITLRRALLRAKQITS